MNIEPTSLLPKRKLIWGNALNLDWNKSVVKIIFLFNLFLAKVFMVELSFLFFFPSCWMCIIYSTMFSL